MRFIPVGAGFGLEIFAWRRRCGAQASARHLISDLRSRARELGCAGLRLDLSRPNVEASGFYARLGARMEEDIALMRLSVRG
jgi:hypothetical protein